MKSAWLKLRTLISGRRLDWLAAGFLLVLAVLFLWRVVFLGHILLPLDAIYAAEPWRSESLVKFPGPNWNSLLTDSIWASYPTAVYASQAARSGGIFWDPNVLAGTPALARGDLFSNPIFHLLALFLLPAQAISWMAVLHLFLGGAFMFLLLREMGAGRFGAMVGSLAFAFNGYLVGWLSIPNTMGAMVWLPLIFWGFERAARRKDWRWGLLGALAFTLQILSGFLLWPFYGAITFVLFVFFRGAITLVKERKAAPALRLWAYGAAILGVGALLAAPWLFSTLQLFPETQRTELLGKDSFMSMGQHLLRLLAPAAYGAGLFGARYRGEYNYSETDLYFGVLPLLFVIAGLFSNQRRITWLLGAFGLFALLALYNILPFKQIVQLVYPIFLNTFPGRIFYVVAFAWAGVAGLGADWLNKKRPARFLKALSLVAFSLALAMLALYLLTINYPAFEAAGLKAVALELKHLRANNASLLAASSFLVLAALLFLAWRQGRLKPWAFRALSLSLVVGDLFWAGIDYNPAFDARFVFPETPSLQALDALGAQESQPYRVLSVNAGQLLPGMAPEVYGIPTVSGYSSWVLRRFSEYISLTGSGQASSINLIVFDDCCHPLLNALNVRYVYAAPGYLPSSTGALDFITWFGKDPEYQVKRKKLQATNWDIQGVKRRVLSEYAPGLVSFPLRLEGAPVFSAYIAVDPEAWGQGGDGMLFEITVSPSEGGAEEKLFSQTLDPARLPADRAWIPVEVDLSRFAGQEVVLSLVTGSGPNKDDGYDWAGWGEPQIRGYFPATLQLVQDGPNRIYRNPQALPRAWVVRRFTPAPAGDLQAVKASLGASGFDPAAEAVVETAPGEPLPFPSLPQGRILASEPERVQVTSYAAQRVEILADLAAPGLLVLSDVMYPGWVVSVDGAPGKIYNTNLIMRGVFLPAGAHQVEFVYRPVMFLRGLWVAGAALLMIAAALLWSSRKSLKSSIPIFHNL